MMRLGTWAVIGVAAALAGVAWYVVPPARPRGFSGLEFALLTPSAAARAPLMTTRGALVFDVIKDSPADKAGIKPGEVAAAIDGEAITSARQASDIVAAHRAGDKVTFTLFDETKGDVQPQDVALVFIAAPPVTKKLSIRPPRTLAREYFYPPAMAANADWSRRIARGPMIKLHQLYGIGDGRCNGFAPEEWEVRGHAKDDTMFHIAAKAGFQHAIFATARLNGQTPADFVRDLLQKSFLAPATLTPPQQFGDFTLVDFGNGNGATGFAEYTVRDGRIAVWIAGVPGADAAWARQIAGAVAFTLSCHSAFTPPPRKPDAPLPPTSVSLACQDGRCEESDLAAAYLAALKTGYVHNLKGEVFLINPRRDLWQNGPEGAGFYRQVGGENEKLEPGRIN